jgi:acetoin utilization transport system ATP-binding protein
VKIELRGICHKLESRQMLDDINLTVNSGQCLVVSGRSGSGKSLLFSIVCGLLIPDAGQVLVNDQPIDEMSEDQNQHFRKYLGVVFQVSALLSNLTLLENLMLPLNQHFPERDCDQKRRDVETICQEFGLNEHTDQRVGQLSTGQAALAGLARALLIEPKCLVWDSPMSEIDLQWGSHVTNRLKHLKDSGTTFILLTNRQWVIDELADIRLDLSAPRAL